MSDEKTVIELLAKQYSVTPALVRLVAGAHPDIFTARAVHGRAAIDGDALIATLPPTMVAPLLRYLAFGDPMGGFLTYLVAGDLFNAACNADGINAPSLHSFAVWIAFTWPAAAYSSREKVARWIQKRGLNAARPLPILLESMERYAATACPCGRILEWFNGGTLVPVLPPWEVTIDCDCGVRWVAGVDSDGRPWGPLRPPPS